MFRIFNQAIVLTFLFTCAVEVSASSIDPEVEACIRSNAPKTTVIEKIRLTSEALMYEYESDGLMHEDEGVFSVKVYWKKFPEGVSKILAVFENPDDISGSRLLFLDKKPENEIYLYMPALFMVRRISSDSLSSSMYGMDFSYEDFQFMYNMMATAVSEQRPDSVIDGRSMYVFAIAPGAGEKSLYEEIHSYFDKKSCVIRKVEFFERGKKLRKVLDIDPGSIKEVNGILIPHKYRMHDLEEDSSTDVTVVSISVDEEIKDVLFDPKQLKEHRGIQ